MTFLKKWLELNKVTVQSLLKYSGGLIKEKTLYDLIGRPNPRLEHLLVFQQIASRRKRRNVSLSELLVGGRSRKKTDPSQWILRRLLKVKQIEYQAIADLCNVTLYTAKRWTRHPMTMRIETIHKIAEFVGVKIEDLFDPKVVAELEKLKALTAPIKKIKIKAHSTKPLSVKPKQTEKYQVNLSTEPKERKPRSSLEFVSRETRAKNFVKYQRRQQVKVSGIPEKINQSLDRFIAERYANKGKPKI